MGPRWLSLPCYASKSEYHAAHQVQGVVVLGVAAGAVVVGLAAIELGVEHVLELKSRVEPGQRRQFEDHPAAVRAAGRTAAHRACRVAQRIGCAGGREIAGRESG